jgi:RNA polymerase sigma factor (sigma-70 family)
MDTDKLMEALKSGEPWAGPALVTIMGPMLMTHAARVGGDLGTADREEAVERALETAARKIDKYDETRGGPGAWLRPFVTYAVADIRRTKPNYAALEPEHIPEPTAEDETPPRPEAERIGWLVRELSETDQVILRLREVENLDYAQIAERIGGVSEGACRVRHHRAVKRLAILARDSGDFDALVEPQEIT